LAWSFEPDCIPDPPEVLPSILIDPDNWVNPETDIEEEELDDWWLLLEEPEKPELEEPEEPKEPEKPEEPEELEELEAPEAPEEPEKPEEPDGLFPILELPVELESVDEDGERLLANTQA